MLVRIRRLAGSVVGGGFILLLALSMLQMGDGSNPLSYFRSSPTVVSVGDASVNWDELPLIATASQSLFPYSSEAYAEETYGSLLTTLAAEDAWNGGTKGLTTAGRQQLLSLVSARTGNTAAADMLEDRLGPIAAFYGALSGQIEDQSLTLPRTLRSAPANQVTQAFDFEILTISIDFNNAETPEDSVLETYLADNADRFERPASWNIDAVILTADTLAQTLEISEDQLRVYYNNNADDFDITEAHEVITITFATALEGTLFTAQINQGLSVAEALAVSNTQTTGAGLRPVTALSAEETAFIAGAQPGAVSEPTIDENGGSSYLYYAQGVEAQSLSYEQARDQVEAALRQSLARDNFKDEVDKAQIAFATDLEGLADQWGASVQTFEGLQTVETAPTALQSQALFTNLNFQRLVSPDLSRSVLDVNQREMISRVTAYEDARTFTLEEARERVLADWQRQQAVDLAQSQADDAKAQLESGESLEAVALAFANADGEAATTSTEQGISKLKIAREIETLGSTFLSQWDAAAAARFTGAVATFTQQSILALNEEVTSPFSMADGEVRIIDQGPSLLIVRANRLAENAEDALETNEDATNADLIAQERTDLIASLSSYNAGAINSIVRTTALFTDVAEGRAYNVNEDAITEQQSLAQQRLAVQQAQAQNAGY